MKPLKSQLSELDGVEGELAGLFAAAPAYRRNTVRKRRIKAMVLGGTREARRPLGLALAAALLIAGTATAATLGHRLLTQQEEPSARLPKPPEVRVPALPAQHVPREIEPPAPPAKPEVKASEAPPRLQRQPAQRLAARRAPKAGAAARTRQQPPGEDPTRVVQAIRALRQQGDAAKAQGLLKDYMKKNPDGVLSEEALALSIEAAHTRKDPKAKAYARRYLARYPGGRHSGFAQRVLAE